MEDFTRAMDPNLNGFNKAMDPKENGLADAFNPDLHGFNKAMNPNENGLADGFKKFQFQLSQEGNNIEKATSLTKNNLIKKLLTHFHSMPPVC